MPDIEDHGAQTQGGDCQREKDVLNIVEATSEDERSATMPEADGIIPTPRHEWNEEQMPPH
eukprot:8889394-Pyramimonas_sp.AAC.1